MFQKLFAIKYKNKTFLLLRSIGDNRITFLEYKNGKIEYPIFEDYKELNDIYNNYDYTVFSAKKYPVKEKVNWKGILLNVIVDGSIIVGAAHLLAKPVINAVDIYAESLYNDSIITREELPLYFEEKITREDVIKAIYLNGEIPDNIKPIAVKVMDTNIELDPNVDLRIYYENISRLKVHIIKNDDTTYDEYRGIRCGWFQVHDQELFIFEEFAIDDRVVSHEFNHILHSFILTEDGKHYYVVDTNGHALSEGMTELLASQDNPISYKLERLFLLFLMDNADDFDHHTYNSIGIKALIEELKTKYPETDIDYIISYIDTYAKSEEDSNISMDKFSDEELFDELFSMVESNVNNYDSFIDFLKIVNFDSDINVVEKYVNKYNELLEKNNIEKVDFFEILRLLYLDDTTSLKELPEEMKVQIIERDFNEIISNINDENIYNIYDFITLVKQLNCESVSSKDYLDKYDLEIINRGYLTKEEIDLVRQIVSVIKTEDSCEWCTTFDFFIESNSKLGFSNIFPFGKNYVPNVITPFGAIESKNITDEAFELEKVDDSDENGILRYLINHPDARENGKWYKNKKDEVINSLFFKTERMYNELENGEILFDSVTPDMMVEIGLKDNGKPGFKLYKNNIVIYETCSEFTSPTAKIPYSIYIKLINDEWAEEIPSVEDLLSIKYFQYINPTALNYFVPNVKIRLEKTGNIYNYTYEISEAKKLILDGKEVDMNKIYIYRILEDEGEYYYLHMLDENEELLGEFMDLNLHLGHLQMPLDIIFLDKILAYYNIQADENNIYHLTKTDIYNMVHNYVSKEEVEIIK